MNQILKQKKGTLVENLGNPDKNSSFGKSSLVK